MSTATIGVDLATSTFSTCEVDDTGPVVRRLDCMRDTFAAWLAQLPADTIVAMIAFQPPAHPTFRSGRATALRNHPDRAR